MVGTMATTDRQKNERILNLILKKITNKIG
jgi:hypothetical protein